VERREQALREQLALAARLGAAYVITHLSPYPMPARPERREALLDRLCAGLRLVTALCQDLGLEVHIENTYQGVGFYRWFYRAVLGRGIAGSHVCFDIGHAKVWSCDSLRAWLDMLADLTTAGLRLHVHLHANGGLGDDHLSFLEAERLGITGPDSFTGDLDYYQGLAEIARRFPSSIKVFEVPAGEAQENLDHVLGRIVAVKSVEDSIAAVGLDSELPAADELQGRYS
jgi:sugar phosphate isomerase/epimerase